MFALKGNLGSALRTLLSLLRTRARMSMWSVHVCALHKQPVTTEKSEEVNDT